MEYGTNSRDIMSGWGKRSYGFGGNSESFTDHGLRAGWGKRSSVQTNTGSSNNNYSEGMYAQ